MRPFLVTVALLIALALTVNLGAEWNRQRYEQRIQLASASFRPGQAILGYRYFSERRFQRARIAVIPRPRIVVFGSSRALPISTAIVGVSPGEFYNTGVDDATVEDCIALWSLLDRHGKTPQLAVFSMDVWMLSERHTTIEWRHNANEVNRFLERASRQPGRLALFVERLAYGWREVKEFLSLSMLTASLRDLERAATGRKHRDTDIFQALAREVVPERDVHGQRAFRADGSVMNNVPSEGPSVVRNWAIASILGDLRGVKNFKWSDEGAARLELLWRDMAAYQVKLVAYMPPYHPAAWALIRKDARYVAALSETSAQLSSLAARVGVHFQDFSDPASIPCREEEFYDGDHPKETCLTRLLGRLGSEFAVQTQMPTTPVVD